MQDENLDFIEIENKKSKCKMGCARGKKQMKKLKFSSQPMMSLVLFFGCVLHVST